MWTGVGEGLVPAARRHTPTLYEAGDNPKDWAAHALSYASGDHIIAIGCSIGGSVALELAKLAPDRITALVLIGTKARYDPDPNMHRNAVGLLREKGMEAAWAHYWQPLISSTTLKEISTRIRQLAQRQPIENVIRGVNAFHTRASRQDVLAAFDGPVIVVTGADDPTPGLATSQQQTELAKHGQLHVVPRCGHYVSMEKPNALTKILNDLILEVGA